MLLEKGATIDPLRLPVGDRHVLWPQFTPQRLLQADGSLDYAKLPEFTEAERRDVPPIGDCGLPTHSHVMTSVSVIHDAALKDMPWSIETLLKAGASPHTSSERRPPLHEAARRGNIECARVLLNGGADINRSNGRTREHPNGTEETALYEAFLTDQREMVEYLHNRGAAWPHRDSVNLDWFREWFQENVGSGTGE